jgi:hypothetical protein
LLMEIENETEKEVRSMGELDLDQIERLLRPEWEKERPRQKRPSVTEPELVDEVPPSRRDGCECLQARQ